MFNKIKKMDANVIKEIEISEKIRHIPNYQYRFLPIEKFTEITVKDMTNHQITKTDLITVYLRDVGNVTIRQYFERVSLNANKKTYEALVSFEQYLRETISIMNLYNIRHLNIDSNSILMDEINNVPLIQFSDNTEKKNLTYPIDYYILNSQATKDSVERKNEIITENVAEEIFDEFWRNKIIFERKIISDTEFIELKEQYNIYIREFIGTPIKTLKRKLNGHKKHWDDYLLSVMILEIIAMFDDDTPNALLNELKRKQKQRILTL
jgi:hypothetical protein